MESYYNFFLVWLVQTQVAITIVSIVLQEFPDRSAKPKAKFWTSVLFSKNIRVLSGLHYIVVCRRYLVALYENFPIIHTQLQKILFK